MPQRPPNKKLRKFRNSPEDFFADSGNRLLRAAGGLLVPHLLRNDVAMSVLEDPVEMLRRSRAAGLVAWYDRRDAIRRQQILDAAGRPVLSVIMAAWNAADSIDRAIASVLGQSYRNLELIVVNDGSVDRTAELVNAWAERDTRVRLVTTDRQRGAAVARNVGLAEATGDYLTFHDADDASHPERLERQLAALLSQPDAAICICNFRRETADGKRVTINGRRFAKIVLSMVFPRRPVFERVGYMLDIKVGEDTEYYERIRAVFGRAREVHLFQTLYWARFAAESLLFSNGNTDFDAERNAVTHQRSDEAERDYQDIKERIRRLESGDLEPYVPLSTSRTSASRTHGILPNNACESVNESEG